MEDEVNGTTVIVDVQPFAFITIIRIEGERFSLERANGEVGDDFLRELVWPVVIRAVAYGNGQTERVVIGADSHIGTGFGSVIRSTGAGGAFFCKLLIRIKRQISINF